MKTTALKYLSILLLLVLCGCHDSDVFLPDGEREVTFSIRVPNTGNPQSRALGAADENNVQTLDILLFDSNGNYTYQPIYSNIAGTSGSNTFTFTVKVPEGTYDMVFLANARQSLLAALPTMIGGTAKATVMNQILVSNSAAWNNTPGSSGYIPIPMWGEVPSITISDTAPVNTSVTLSRTLVRIDVSLSAAVQPNLSLTSVRLYSYNNQGLVAPVAANWDAVNVVATAPSVPATAQQSITPLVYSGADITTPGIASQNAIYTFEAVAGNNNFYLNNTCLVIGGLYDGSTTETFYRIDFLDANSAYLPLLRNHTYEVSVTTISGPGLNTPDIAFSSRPVNVAATVQTWIASASNNPSINGPYRLTVSEGVVPLGSSAPVGSTITVYTNYPAGWTVSGFFDGTGAAINWLSTDVPSGATNTTQNVTVSAALNGTNAPRTGYIYLTAGRITYTVEVTQPTHSGWAGNNIYWNGSIMTFDDVNVQTHNTYQGIYFTWGSLWGVSAVPGAWSATRIMYPPSGGSMAAGTQYATWDSWPRLSTFTIPAAGTTQSYLYGYTNATAGVGDICSHLTNMGWAPTGKRWRMPTAQEFLAATDYQQVAGTVTGTYTADGTTSITAGYTKQNSIGTPFFPASGMVADNGTSYGLLFYPGTDGYYFSSSIYIVNSGASQLHFNLPNSTVAPGSNYYLNTASPIRCVVE